MKFISLFLTMIIWMFLACSENDVLYDSYMQLDIESLEGMGEAYEHALIYNDSLILCKVDINTCNNSQSQHYDDMFHFYVEQFNLHHSNYSHNNISDDHHHANGQRVRHGWMMNDAHDEEPGSDNNSSHMQDQHDDKEGNDYEHSISSMDEMMELIEHHEEEHPG